MDDQATEKKEPQRVACSIPGGLTLQLSGPFADELGTRTIRRYGPQYVVGGPSTVGAAPAISDVDPDFWAEWAQQNRLNPLLATGVIYAVDAEGNPLEPAP